mmetsp:Transcript_52040/g.135499  ORF Transcript_52040/g.135499 Transcript_52040/m.135499 type:complete len:85 (+) Transcript_52040:304-558(+)
MRSDEPDFDREVLKRYGFQTDSSEEYCSQGELVNELTGELLRKTDGSGLTPSNGMSPGAMLCGISSGGLVWMGAASPIFGMMLK